MDVLDIQNQMAMMETQGRYEEFVTSAGNLKRDNQEYVNFNNGLKKGAKTSFYGDDIQLFPENGVLKSDIPE